MDVTPAEAQRRSSMERHADYLGRLEHTLRTDVAIIQGWAELLQDAEESDNAGAVRASGLAAIIGGAHSLSTHLQELLDEAALLARAERMEAGEVDGAAPAAFGEQVC